MVLKSPQTERNESVEYGSLLIQEFLDVVQGTLLDLGVYLSDVDSDAAYADDGDTANEPDAQHERRPTVFCRTGDEGIEHIDTDEETDKDETDADVHDVVDGLHGEGCDAV